MFLQVSVCPRGEGLPQCMLGDPPCQEDPPLCQGDPPAKETPLQAHTGGGELRGIRSRPTPKGEIQGDQIQVHTQGGNSGGSDPGPTPRSRLWYTVNEWLVRILLECILVFALFFN